MTCPFGVPESRFTRRDFRKSPASTSGTNCSRTTRLKRSTLEAFRRFISFRNCWLVSNVGTGHRLEHLLRVGEHDAVPVLQLLVDRALSGLPLRCPEPRLVGAGPAAHCPCRSGHQGGNDHDLLRRELHCSSPSENFQVPLAELPTLGANFPDPLRAPQFSQ